VSCTSQSNFQLIPATITKNIRIDGTTPGGTITVYFVPRTITAASASADINCNLINKIDQSPAAIDISLYPNPAQNKIYLSTDKSIADRSIEIYSMFGKLIYAGVFHAGQPSISIDLALPDGAYILTLGNVHERISKNFMILH
jgi:hypothetical protein